MASQPDGSIVIDTEIKKDGAVEGVDSLKGVLKELIATIKDLNVELQSSFNGFQGKATQAASGVDEITSSAKSAKNEVESLEEQMAKIKVENNFSPSYSDGSEGETEEEYLARADAIIAKQREMRKSSLETAGTIEEYFEEADEPPGMLLQTFEMVKASLYGIPQLAKMAGSAIKSGFASGEQETSTVADRVDTLKDSLSALEQQGLYFGDEEYDKTYAELNKAQNELKEYKKQLEGTNTEQKKVAKSGKKMNSSLKKTKKVTPPLTKSILKLSNMLKLMAIRMIFRAAIDAAKKGFENLARYSDNTNKAISQLMSAMTMLKNSFAVAVSPLVQLLSPAISKLISQLAELNNWIGQTAAALTGQDTFTKAVAVQEDYAASLSDTQKAAKKAAKAMKNTFKFDDLIKLQKTASTDYTGPTPSDMFETKEVSNQAKVMATNIKKTLSDLFKPIQESWEEYGPATFAAVNTMLSSLKKLAGDIGQSFIEVWNDEGYGKTISSDLIVTFDNLALTVANLAKQFDIAWESADIGTSIMRHLGDIVVEITGFFREASESIKNWAAELDFAPLLKAFDGLLVSIRPIISKVGDLLLWLLDEILLPLSKWAIETALPTVMDLVSAALDVLSSTIDALQPLANWLWQDFIKPIGAWTGEVIINAIKGITDKLHDFSDWIKSNQGMVENATIIIGAFFAAFAFTKFITGIGLMINALPGLISMMGLLFNSINPVMIVLAAIVGIAAYVARAWDKMTPGEQLAVEIIAVAGAIALVVAAIAAGLHDFMTMAIAGSIAAIAGFSLVGIAHGANSRYRNRNFSTGGGGRSFGSSKYSSLKSVMPHLATGTVVPPSAGEFAAVLGDNNKDYEVVSPLGTIKQAVMEALAESGGLGNGGNNTYVMEVDGTKFAKVVHKFNAQEADRVGIRMVSTAGG